MTFVVKGNMLYQFNVDTLELKNKVTLQTHADIKEMFVTPEQLEIELAYPRLM